MSAIPNLPTDIPPVETNGTTNGMSRAPFVLQDRPVENLRPLKVIVIGAGYSGIYCGIRIPERLRNVDLTIYEKNDGIGGTWWENRSAIYLPSHSMTSPQNTSDGFDTHVLRQFVSGSFVRYWTDRYIDTSDAPATYHVSPTSPTISLATDQKTSTFIPILLRTKSQLVLSLRTRTRNPKVPRRRCEEVLRRSLHQALPRNQGMPMG